VSNFAQDDAVMGARGSDGKGWENSNNNGNSIGNGDDNSNSNSRSPSGMTTRGAGNSNGKNQKDGQQQRARIRRMGDKRGLGRSKTVAVGARLLRGTGSRDDF
jgi:hypothetical protein